MPLSRGEITSLHRAVRLTARGSALLFAAAQAAPVLGRQPARAARPLYLAFAAAHAVHFAVVTRYGVATGGRAMFPGGRSLADVGGWPTVLAIYTLFGGLVLTGWVAGPPPTNGPPRQPVAWRAATGLIGSMFVGTYLGQLTHSRWYAAPATLVGAAVAGNVLAAHRRPATID